MPSRLHRFCDRLTEALICFAIIFGPWAFGTTQDWSVRVMNGAGFALGLLWLVKLAARVAVTPPSPVGESDAPVASSQNQANPNGQSATKVSPARSCDEASQPPLRAENWFTGLLATATLVILAYCLVSAWNARAIYQPNQWHFEYRPAISWLPHSFDQAASWGAFWKYLGLAGLFWALRDWLLAGSDGGQQTTGGTPLPASGHLLPSAEKERSTERSVVSDQRSGVSGSTSLPPRLRRLFWVLTLNGAALAIQSLMQRAEGGGELLWLVEPHINKTADAQFGPYAYRSNAAQYFNLLWPAVLGFWWAGISSLRRRRSSIRSEHRNRLAVLLPCVLIMAICPLVTASRGGAIVAAGSLIMAAGILAAAQWRQRWLTKLGILLGMAAVVGGGALLGWQTLAPRMEMLHEGYELREGLYVTGRYMAQDNSWFGTGPGTFETMYQLYCQSKPDDLLAQMHNDWLETLITFGRFGSVPIFLSLLLVLSRWFWNGDGIHGNKYFVFLLWVSLAGCMIHAFFDFPFQIHSVLSLFLILCVVLSCLTRKPVS